MPIGCTSRGVGNLVLWDPHTQISNNRPPGTIITGAPGSGKTYFSETIAVIQALLGKTLVILDWKGDFLALKSLEDEIGPVNIWRVGDKDAEPGGLDPFSMSDDPIEQRSLARTVIEIFLGGLTREEMTTLSNIIDDVLKECRQRQIQPSLGDVKDRLRGSSNKLARDLGHQLKDIADHPLSKICFAPGNRKRSATGGIIGAGETTVATLLGLDLPSSPEDAKSTAEKRLTSGIFSLLTHFIYKLLHDQDKSIPKVLIIDEAWAILSSPMGKDVVKKISLLGRSKNIALIMATQNYSHFDDSGLENTIGTRFAFRAELQEAESVIKNLQLEQGFEEVITSLDNGECLMRDWRARFATVRIKNWNTRWGQAFETNPEKRRAIEAVQTG